MYAEAAGIQQIVPIAVALPADAGDLSVLVRWAADERVSLTPRGAGSSMAGGAVGPGVVVDLSPWNGIEGVSVADEMVRVSPGAVCHAVNGAAHRVGLRFPISPSSARFCTIGGMVGTNAAGAATLKYGPMRAWVRGIECVFADGSRGWVRRDSADPDAPAVRRFNEIASDLREAERAMPSRHAGVRKESSGYGLADWAQSGSLVDLLVGSEGTLAFFTSIELRLAPVPAASASLLAAFTSIEAAVEAAFLAAELNATSCELLDRTFLDIARAGGTADVPEETDAILLVDVEESSAERLQELARAVETGFIDAGAMRVETALDAEHAARLWHLRHAASPALAELAPETRSMQVIEDGAVPPERLADYVRGVRGTLNRHGLRGVLFGHAGDGHLHANVLVDPQAAGWQDRLRGVFEDVVELTASLGGTMAGEHGDGRLRAGVLDRMWPAAVVERMREVKAAFDPDRILNPGVKLASAGAKALAGQAIKYDPALPSLPVEARRVLDRVQRERRWDRSRLALLDEETAR